MEALGGPGRFLSGPERSGQDPASTILKAFEAREVSEPLAVLERVAKPHSGPPEWVGGSLEGGQGHRIPPFRQAHV